MKLAKIQGYFTTRDLDSVKDKITAGALKDIYKQIKEKQIYLVLPRSKKKIGELVAATIDKKGIQGTFILYKDSPHYYLTLFGINTFFKGFSILYRTLEGEEKRGVRYLNKIKLLNVILAEKPCNRQCLINNKSKKLILNILVEEIKDNGT